MSYTILAFGDSLTWGKNPSSGERHAEADRWPSVLQAELGEKGHVIPEGLRGRTTIFDDPTAPYEKNGARALPMLLSTHQPLDLVVLFLGTNDLKPAVCGSVAGVVVGLEKLVAIVRNFPYHKSCPAPDILIVSPPHLCKTAAGADPGGGRSVEESRRLTPATRSLCERLGCLFLDAAQVAQSSPVDGVHLDAANTRAIGKAVARLLRGRLGSEVDAAAVSSHGSEA